MAARHEMPEEPSFCEDEDEGSLDDTLEDKSTKKRTKTAAVKGPWAKEEDDVVIRLVGQYGPKRWSLIASNLPGRESHGPRQLSHPPPSPETRRVCSAYLLRRQMQLDMYTRTPGTGKQCRERWHNQLDPNIKKEGWSEEEDRVLLQAHTELGNHWVEISKVCPRLTSFPHTFFVFVAICATRRVLPDPLISLSCGAFCNYPAIVPHSDCPDGQTTQSRIGGTPPCANE